MYRRTGFTLRRGRIPQEEEITFPKAEATGMPASAKSEEEGTGDREPRAPPEAERSEHVS